jgi:hypothetical protein
LKVSVIAPMGTSPPIVTEFLQYLVDIRGIRVNDLIILTTLGPHLRHRIPIVKNKHEDKDH